MNNTICIINFQANRECERNNNILNKSKRVGKEEKGARRSREIRKSLVNIVNLNSNILAATLNK